MQLDISRLRSELELLEKIKVPVKSNHQDPRQITLQTSIDRDHTNWWERGQDYTIPIYDEIPYINSIMAQYKMASSRVMKLKPMTCYTWHTDATKRIHIPIVVTEGSGMIVDNEVIRFKEGLLTLVDTTKYHTAFNPGKEDRIHIVGLAL